MKNSNYYIIKKKQLAETINFITGERYFVWDDKEDSSKKVYSFKITERFEKAFKEINALKKQFM